MSNEHVSMSYRQITALMDQCQKSDEILEILREEVAGPNRPAFVSRIYGRYDTLRRAEERVDLARAAAGDVAAWLRPVDDSPQPPARAAGKRAGKGAATPVQAPPATAPSRASRQAAGARR